MIVNASEQMFTRNDTMAQYSLAFDFGATSIRAILGAVEDGRFTCKEVMRMSHQRETVNGRSRW